MTALISAKALVSAAAGAAIMATADSIPAAAFSLRLYQPDEPAKITPDEPDELRLLIARLSQLLPAATAAQPAGEAKTLRDCWAVLKRIRTQKPATREEYERCLDRFDEFWRSSNRTLCPVVGKGSPSLSLIAETTLADFRDWLATQKTKAGTLFRATNVAKHFRPLKALLNEAAAQGWIARAPRKPQLRKIAAKPITFIRPEILTKFLQRVASHPPDWPTSKHSGGLSSQTYWRGLVTLIWHYGFRRCELTEKLTWRNRDSELGELGVFFQTQSPIQAIDLKSEFGWLVYAPEKQQWSKPGALVLPLTRVCRSILETIRREQGLGAGDWPNSPVLPSPASHPARDRVLKSIRIGAGIDLHFTLHDLRKTSETFWNGAESSLGTFVTGHAGRSVSDQSYDQKLVRLLSLLPTLDSRADYPRGFLEFGLTSSC